MAVNHPSMCGEDLAYYLAEKAGAFAWLGTALPQGETWPLHSCRLMWKTISRESGESAASKMELRYRGGGDEAACS